MFGYITPDKPYLCFKDFTLFRAFYCGSCHCVGKKYGQIPRLTTNYDSTFIQVVVYSFLNKRPMFIDKACILNPFNKKTCVVSDPLLNDLAAFNILLCYHNILDDIVDGGSINKRIALSGISSAYKKAVKRLPKCDEIIRERYDELRRLEADCCPNFDQAAEPFGRMMAGGIRAVIEAYRRIELPQAHDDKNTDHDKSQNSEPLDGKNDSVATKDLQNFYDLDTESDVNGNSLETGSLFANEHPKDSGNSYLTYSPQELALKTNQSNIITEYPHVPQKVRLKSLPPNVIETTLINDPTKVTAKGTIKSEPIIAPIKPMPLVRDLSLLEDFCFHLGRYIYLIDALDDLNEDYRHGNYNPFIAAFPTFMDRASFLSYHGEEIRKSINITINQIISSYNALGLTEAKNLLDNIIFRGLIRKAELIFSGVKNARKEKL